MRRGSSTRNGQPSTATYQVLLTRGMKGTGVFSTDPETQAFLDEMCR